MSNSSEMGVQSGGGGNYGNTTRPGTRKAAETMFYQPKIQVCESCENAASNVAPSKVPLHATAASRVPLQVVAASRDDLQTSSSSSDSSKVTIQSSSDLTQCSVKPPFLPPRELTKRHTMPPSPTRVNNHTNEKPPRPPRYFPTRTDTELQLSHTELQLSSNSTPQRNWDMYKTIPQHVACNGNSKFASRNEIFSLYTKDNNQSYSPQLNNNGSQNSSDLQPQNSKTSHEDETYFENFIKYKAALAEKQNYHNYNKEYGFANSIPTSKPPLYANQSTKPLKSILKHGSKLKASKSESSLLDCFEEDNLHSDIEISSEIHMDTTTMSDELPTIEESPDSRPQNGTFYQPPPHMNPRRSSLGSILRQPWRAQTHLNLSNLTDTPAFNPTCSTTESQHSLYSSQDTLVNHSLNSSYHEQLDKSDTSIKHNGSYLEENNRIDRRKQNRIERRRKEWYEEDDEDGGTEEEETGGGVREVDSWMNEFEADAHTTSIPELYSFDDFRSSPQPKQTESRIYSNANELTDRGHRFRHSTGGHEFVRAKTVPDALVSRGEEIAPEKCAPMKQDPCKDGVVTFHNDDSALVGTDGRAFRRATSVDGKQYWRNKQRKPQGSAWTLDGNSSPLSPLSPVNTNACTSTPQLYYVTPPKSMAVPAVHDGRLERSGSGRGGSFSRLARRLSQREKRSDRDDKATADRKKTLRQRSVSLDCGDTRRPLNDGVACTSAGDAVLCIPPSPSMPLRMSHVRGFSSSPGSPRTLSRTSTGGSRQPKSDKRKRSIQDLQELFVAIESQDLDHVKRILDTCVVDVNAQNVDELTPLDIAVFMNHVPMAKLLLSHGARENPKFLKSNEECKIKLANLVLDAEKRVQQLTQRQTDTPATAWSSSQIKEHEKLLNHCKYRLKFFQRMKKGYDGARPPEQPSNVRLCISSPSSVQISFEEPTCHNGAVVTRYKVEWSCYEGFSPLGGELLIENPQVKQCHIPNLAPGNAYYVRLYAWNLKGWSEPAPTNPACVTPTWWREVDGTADRMEGKLKLLSTLFTNMKNSRSPEAAIIKDQNDNSPMPSRKSNVRKSIKNLFSGAPKFQKSLKRGVYLSAIVCCEDRLLVTHEDQLPIVEVDENFTSTSLNQHFHWLMKIACTWEDVKSLRQDMDRIPSANAFHLRSKLLQAAHQLQSALGLNDLGRFYHTPVKDTNGSIVLVTVTRVRDAKCVSTAHCKWSAHSKLMKRIATSDCFAAPEMLLQNSQEMLLYGESAKKTLTKGLYLGYLKLTSSVELVRIMVPEHMPNILPHAKIRDNSHVTKEEWAWLRSLSLNEAQTPPTELQSGFHQSLTEASKHLLEQLGINNDSAMNHRLYDLELIELSDDVSMILLLPPVDSVCNAPGTKQQLTNQPGYFTLPIQVFEMIHMCAYQYEFISRYCRISSILEMDTYLAQQAQREAFSTEELSEAKQRVEQLTGFSKPLDEAWKSVRWTVEIITYARDKSVRGGVPLATLHAPPTSNNPSGSDVVSSACSDPGYHSDLSSMDNSIDQVIMSSNSISNTGVAGNINGSDIPKIHHHHRHNNHHHHHQAKGAGQLRRSSPALECTCDLQTTGSSSSRDSTQGHSEHCDAFTRTHRHEKWARHQPPPESDILNIRAAYDTGLARGASVKLQITSGITSRDVIDIVVDQLNKKVLETPDITSPKIYPKECLGDFCLVAVIGARERVLRDDYQPLMLQYPWTRGQLCVRKKADLLAALELQGSQITNV